MWGSKLLHLSLITHATQHLNKGTIMDNKKEALIIIGRELSARQDDFNRVKMQFGNMTEEESNKEYGQSGRTFGDILKGYKESFDKVAACLNWIKTRI